MVLPIGINMVGFSHREVTQTVTIVAKDETEARDLFRKALSSQKAERQALMEKIGREPRYWTGLDTLNASHWHNAEVEEIELDQAAVYAP